MATDFQPTSYTFTCFANSLGFGVGSVTSAGYNGLSSRVGNVGLGMLADLLKVKVNVLLPYCNFPKEVLHIGIMLALFTMLLLSD